MIGQPLSQGVPSGSGKRLPGIDSMRYVAIACVVLAHSYRRDDPVWLFIKEALRFVIPFFFMTSGYLLTGKLVGNDKPATYLRYAGRIMVLYLAWSIIYFLNPQFHDIRTLGLVNAYVLRWQRFLAAGPERIVFEGVAFHFWFFVSLIFTTLFYLLFRVRGVRTMLIVSALLFVFGIVARSYAETPIGLSVDFNTRYFIFFSALPFSIGAYIRSRDLQVSNTMALALFFGGMALSLAEGWFLHAHYGQRVKDFDFSTILLGLGAFWVAKNGLGWLKNPFLAQLGRLSLGIYAVHVIIAERLVSFSQDPALAEAWHFIETPLVLFISTAFILLLKRTRLAAALI